MAWHGVPRVQYTNWKVTLINIGQELSVRVLAGCTHPSNSAQVTSAASRVSFLLKSLHHHLLPYTPYLTTSTSNTLFFHMSVIVTQAVKWELLRERLEELPNIRKVREFWFLNAEGSQI